MVQNSLTGRLGGIWPASLTPFDPAGAIDRAALAAHLADLAAAPGVRALVVNGHAGEATALDRVEKRLVVEAAKAAVSGRDVLVVAGIVAETAREALALAADAREAEADALLLFPPALLAAGGEKREAMTFRFVEEVAAVGLPIVLFQLSLASGLGLPTPMLLRLCASVPAIVAVKEGSDSPAAYEDNLRGLKALDRPVAVLTTNNTWLMASLAYGGDGILSGIGSVASPLLADLFAAMERGDLPAARAANDRLLPLFRCFYRAPACDMHNRMKTALHLMGRLPCPDPRPPLLPIAPDERTRIAEALVAAGLLSRPKIPA